MYINMSLEIIPIMFINKWLTAQKRLKSFLEFLLLADNPFLRAFFFFLYRKSNCIKTAYREKCRENLFRFLISYAMYICAFYCHSSEKNIFYLYVLSHKAQQPTDKKTEEEPPVGSPKKEPGQEKEEGAPVVKGEKGMKEHFVFYL